MAVMKFNRVWKLIGALAIMTSFSSCNITRGLGESESLLVKSSVKLRGIKKIDESDKLKSDLQLAMLQTPNKKVLGLLPVRLWLYKSVEQKKETKFRWWIKTKVGEAPVLFDESLAERSERLMENYLFNYGFLDGQVSHSFSTKKKKTKLIFEILPGIAWTISSVKFDLQASSADSVVRMKTYYSLLKKGMRFDISKLKQERERIESDLRNKGFYYFNKEYVSFDLDSNSSSRSIDITVRILPPADRPGHQSYNINNIYIYTNYSSDILPEDQRLDSISHNEFTIYYQKKLMFKPRILEEAVFLRKGLLYSRTDYDKTLSRLAQLGAFKFTGIDFLPADSVGRTLNAYIYLSPAKRQGFGAEGQANVNNEGLLGTSISLNYRNRNLSKGADQLTVNADAGVQLQITRKDKVQLITSVANAGITYYVNRFLIPFRSKLFGKSINPKTRISLLYNFEQRFDFVDASFLYTLHNFSLTYGYEWNPSRFKRHLFNPIAVNTFLLPKTGQAFKQTLEKNPILRSSYQEQIILASNYTFIYFNQRGESDNRFMYLSLNGEIAGNIWYGGFRLRNLKSGQSSGFTIFGKDFSQYARIEGDLRNYYKLGKKAMIATRIYAGAGFSYGNSSIMPFTRQFYIGGPNSMRGFQIRSVGPGGYYDFADTLANSITFFNQTGDIKLEMNAELRFDIFKWFKGALFADVGNIWLLRNDPARPEGVFRFNRFWDQFAINTGAGVRMDFSYFVIRLDYGVPVRLPWLSGNPWTFTKGQFNLAIGYPF